MFQRREKGVKSESFPPAILVARNGNRCQMKEKRPLWIVFLFVAFLAVTFVFHGTADDYEDENNNRALLLHDDYEDEYTSALSTIGCFATPDCFPSARCKTGVPQKLQRGKRWEEQSFCVDDLKQAAKQQDGCLVYSFGIHDSWEWEEKVAKQFGCEVHAFDPTVDHAQDLAPGVTFHKLGLQAEGDDMAKTHAAEYDAIDPTLLLALPDIMQRLGHDKRTLDVIMMDCEGCEWGVLRNLACSKESGRVNQIVTEFHFQKSLGLETEVDVLNAAMGVRCLWQENWHVVSIEGSGSSPINWQYARGIPSLLHSPGMLLYITLQRIQEQEGGADHRYRPMVNFDNWERMKEK
jgi:hypothetical protein